MNVFFCVALYIGWTFWQFSIDPLKVVAKLLFQRMETMTASLVIFVF